jgi:hypothetical protein
MKLARRLTPGPLAALLLAGSVSLATVAAAQYPEDPSKPTIAPPSASSVTPPLANDSVGASADRAAPATGLTLRNEPMVSKSNLADAMAEKPIIPSKAELPDAAFKKLDAEAKGYVSKEDVSELNGFEQAFQQADVNKDGKLSPAEFDKAWAYYTGRHG